LNDYAMTTAQPDHSDEDPGAAGTVVTDPSQRSTW
jgi:hypothetical protein